MRLDIVIPAHNEEGRIGRTLDAYLSAWPEDLDTRFIVALDRCTDATSRVVERRMASDPRLRLLEFPKLGKGGVIMEAFRACDAELVGFVDADCATPPSEFLRLVETARCADGAIASRRHPGSVLPARRTFQRRLVSAGFAFGVRTLFRLPFVDTQCGAKVLRSDVVRRVLPLLSARDFLFDVDLLVTARQLGFDIAEVPTIWIDRKGSNVRPAAHAGRMAAGALRLWLHHRVLPIEVDGVGTNGHRRDGDGVEARMELRQVRRGRYARAS